jgi:hypothetical protein
VKFKPRRHRDYGARVNGSEVSGLLDEPRCIFSDRGRLCVNDSAQRNGEEYDQNFFYDFGLVEVFAV